MHRFLSLCSVLWLTAGSVCSAQTFKADSGKFVLSIQENEVATETFTADADGGSTFEGNVALGAQKIKFKSSITAKAGKITAIHLDAQPGGKMDVKIEGNKAKITTNGKVQKEAATPAKFTLFDNFSPHLLTSVTAAYDAQKGGTQTFVMLALGSLTPFKGKLARLSTRPMPIGDKVLPVTKYLMTLPGGAGEVEIELFTNSDSQMLAWNVPAQKFTAIREGYADILKATGPIDPLLSKPTYKVKTETGIKIAMRDGVNTVADVYRPDAEGQFPVILQRTCYGRDKAVEANFYAKRGYVFVAQDVRGKFDSEGKWEPFVNEGRDGHDTVTWCAKQPWSNGKVGMIGGSYLGFVQWAAAREGNPNLKCLIPIVSPPDPFYNIPYAFGAFFLQPALWWAAIVDGKGMNAPKAVPNPQAMLTLPLTDLDQKIFGKKIAFLQDWLKNSTNNAYWEQVNFNDRMKNFSPLPALHISGWFDGDGIGTKRNYAAMVAAGQKNQKLVYGAWPHAVNSVTKIGELDFGPQSLKDLDTLYLRWFDRWLKDVENGVDKEPSVEAFLMGRNEWRKFSAWPPTEATPQKWYFHSSGKANSSEGDGKLSTDAPSASEKPDKYAYNPAKPLMAGSLKKSADPAEAASLDVAKMLKTKDALVYTTEALAKDVNVAGPISVHLSAETSAKDTDWYAMLMDVTPDGKSLALVQGIIRARFRKSSSQPQLLSPKEVADYTVDLWALGHVFQKGHKIRMLVASSFFPTFDRNLNTGEDIATGTKMVTAQQTLYHDSERASYLLLPVLPK